MCAEALRVGLERRAIVIAEKGYDAERVRAHIRAQGAIPIIPNRTNRKKKFRWTMAIYRERKLVEHSINNTNLATIN